MHLSPKTRINDLITAHPFLLDFLVDLSPRFKLLKNPVARKTVGSVATLAQAASIGGLTVEELVAKVADEIARQTGKPVERSAEPAKAEKVTDAGARHELLKAIIRDLHDGADLASVKQRFQELIRDIDASEISRMEQRLIEEGMPETEVKRLCDVHVSVFKESLEGKDAPVVPEGHPVHTFMLENRACESVMNKLEQVLGTLDAAPARLEQYRPNLTKLTTSLQKVDVRYQRKENQLFPVLEKHGISGPSQVMWALHDDIRAMLKKLRGLVDGAEAGAIVTAGREAIRTIRDMIYKEEHILFPLSVDMLPAEDWDRVKHGEQEIGYAWIEPAGNPATVNAAPVPASPAAPDTLELDTGRLTLEQVNLMLKTLPLDISYVDEHDRVAYYSATEDRIFPRSPGVIGRAVQKCHPPKSVHVVQQILDDFRGGRRDNAEFWIQMKGRFLHIRYFAVRNAGGAYKGCIEVTQDVSGIRGLEGEKRLLD